jgi:hypothetical protein
MLKQVSFHIQAHLNAFLRILEYFSQICLVPLATESPWIIQYCCSRIYNLTTSHCNCLIWMYCTYTMREKLNTSRSQRIFQRSRKYFQILGARRVTYSSRQTHNSGVNCEPQCYLALSGRWMWNGTQFCNEVEGVGQQFLCWRYRALKYKTCPGRPWGPPSLLYKGYRVIPRDKAVGAWSWPPTPN